MDRIDLAIFREMWHHRVCWIGGWDRSMSAARIAEHVGLSPSTVSDRLRAWRQTGFIRRVKILPHPSLFGGSFVSVLVRADHARAFEAIDQMLPLVPNLVHGLEVDSGFWVILLDDGVGSVDRAIGLFRTIGGAATEVQWPVNLPPCERRPGREDWATIAALASTPEAPPAQLARRLRVTTKTAIRRTNRLLRSHTIFFHPVTDFIVTPGVFVNFQLTVRPGADVPGLWQTLEQIDPYLVPQGDWEDGRLVTTHALPGRADRSMIAFYWYCESAAQVWARVRELQRLDGVYRVDAQFITRVWRGSSWMDARLISGASPTSAGAKMTALPSSVAVPTARRTSIAHR